MAKINKAYRETIKYMEYRTIEKGFYEVHVSSEHKIMLDGRCCSGFLLEIMERAKQDKAKITRVKGRTSIINDELLEDLQQLRAENKSLRKKHQALKKFFK